MDNKLNELSKPTALRNKHTGRTFNATENTEPQVYESLYSQEYVSALLAEREEKDKRIAELQTKLAKPVRLPRPACVYADHSYPAYSREQVEEIIATAGLRFTVEGDE